MDSTQEKIAYALGLNIALIIIGAVFYKTVEMWSWVDSIYFAVSTLMTVGFGDLHATHSISRIFATCYMLIGIPVMLYTVTLLGAYSVEK
ncbi:MAG: potassium channel family protein, partial [Candidatus Micrarchaeota archaeon]